MTQKNHYCDLKPIQARRPSSRMKSMQNKNKITFSFKYSSKTSYQLSQHIINVINIEDKKDVLRTMENSSFLGQDNSEVCIVF